MRKIWMGRNSGESEERKLVSCEYHIVVTESEGGLACESYGICISLPETGEWVEIFDITVNADRIYQLGELLCRNLVTPCTLREVLDDWL